MDKDIRNDIERATQRARKILEEDFAAQMEGDFDVHRDGVVAVNAGGHLSARQTFQRERMVAAIDHKRSAGMSSVDAVRDYLRDAAFTTLNRFVALKMLEARDLVQECITKGEQSAGYREFCGMAPGLPLLPDSAGYRLYLESQFDELSTEVKVLFDRRDPSSVLWPKRATFEQLLEILNVTELARVWGADETIGWVYQFFNGQDERRKMREESQAPRNSRELAVRNQFFTPRYVVQFLTDNTLGRIWYEMRATKTALAENCEYMVRKSGDKFTPRVKKDPRDLRVLDPACGSGHFLLYAFELLVTIYEEAYADPESPQSEATGKTLSNDYASHEALRKAVPGLVLAHNLHGVDIDPRCAQIAQLALWMRAQKAYRDFGVARGERAQIRRSNIVVAEPLVADEQIARDFVAKLDDGELGRVFMSLVKSLSLAGDLGLLLHVEQLVKTPVRRQGELFIPPEERIHAALAKFVLDEAGPANTRTRLFADDAAHGLALLSVAEKRFDTVLMNPPFGQPVKKLPRQYANLPQDLYCCFVERASTMLKPGGKIGAITSASFRTYVDYQEFRERYFIAGRVPLVADLGWGVLDGAYVETAAYVVEPDDIHYDACTFIDARDSTDRSQTLRLASEDAESNCVYVRSPHLFARLGGKPLIYWWPKDTWDRFASFRTLNSLCSTIGKGAGPHTIFYRLRWEVSPRRIGLSHTWATFVNGGAFAPFHRDNAIVLQWANHGALVKAYLTEKYPYLKGNTDWNIQLEKLYGFSGITYGKKTTTFSAQIMPADGIFSFEGIAIFPSDKADTWWLLAYLNSAFVRWYLNATCGLHKNPPYLRNVPVPEFDETTRRKLERLAQQGRKLQLSVSRHDERSPLFIGVPQVPAEESDDAVQAVLAEIDSEVERFTGISRRELSSHNASVSVDETATEEPEQQQDQETQTDSILLRGLSWSVGIAFGRFDPRLATGERPIPPDPEPFDSMPSRSPGMYPEGEEPGNRPDILVDDEGHADDLVACIHAVAERVKVDLPGNLRGWLAKEFFPLHIKMYSKSRRKAPIYWQLGTPSASYSVWLYIHAYSTDTLFRIQNDYLGGERGKLAYEERRLESLTVELRDGSSAAQRQVLASREAFVEDLRAFLEEVKRVAPLWKPNLDDGVIINFAPLWRLVPQNKSWQKELKATWDALCEGKHDWAHLAMHLWPERVVPRCGEARSLAIAHGLEDVFWVEGTDGRWTSRKTPTRSVDELLRERTSSAVKAALKSLLEAPTAAGKSAGRRGAGGRKSFASANEGDA
jgi:hypothetical protein